ncbi:hypothetical protein QQP08_008421 [Theobroma cacao]|nr:hypothetical protein QQP08_008421 [Theobroma cacao]
MNAVIRNIIIQRRQENAGKAVSVFVSCEKNKVTAQMKSSGSRAVELDKIHLASSYDYRVKTSEKRSENIETAL